MLGLIESRGPEGAPVVAINSPVYVDGTVFADETVGDGLAVTSLAQDVSFAITIADGSTGETILTSATNVMPLANWEADYEGITKMLLCATAGSRIVGAIPTSELSEQAAANLGLSQDGSAVVAIDLQQVFLAAANGVPQYNDRRGMPSVVLAPNGQPGVIIPDVAPPSELAVEVLKKGSGPAITAADSVRIQYTGVTWAEREVFDSSWDKGASIVVTLGGVVPGFSSALAGQAVGSQILAVIPPDLGYGEQGSGSVPPGATLVFVIDILGIDAPATP